MLMGNPGFEHFKTVGEYLGPWMYKWVEQVPGSKSLVEKPKQLSQKSILSAGETLGETPGFLCDTSLS